MPRILRTRVLPKNRVDHACRDARGRRVVRKGVVNQMCRDCRTFIVYVWDNTPKPKPRKRKRQRNGY